MEAFEVCPWARKAREAGEWTREVLLHAEPTIEPSLEAIRRLEARPEGPAVAILIYPLLRLDPRRFDELAARLRQADQARHGGKPVYVAATFHPDYRRDARTPAALVPYFRRSPDPSIQLIRYAVIEEARGTAHGKFLFDFSPAGWGELMRRQMAPSVTDRITRDNHRRQAADGERIEAVYRAILDDRDRTYAALLGSGDPGPGGVPPAGAPKT